MVVGAGDKADYKDVPQDQLTEYESKEPMNPAKIKEHAPTPMPTNVKVNAKMTKWQGNKEEITEPGEAAINAEEAAPVKQLRSR
jgi:hypothetical protein